MVVVSDNDLDGRRKSEGAQAIHRRKKLVKSLLSERKLPQQGWDDLSIESLLQDLSEMDSNNFLEKAGVGEREGRVVSDLVCKRYFRMAHGIGRSGDVSAEQPKAAGSSLMAKLTGFLVADALLLAGLEDCGPPLILPLATGMALAMTLLSTKKLRPPEAKFVVWPRIDQKTCLKCIFAANLEPLIIENRLNGDSLETNLESIEQSILENGANSIVCVISTSSCFAPRGCDDLIGIAQLCATHNIPHIINNAYGVQSAFLCREITSAGRKGRVDAIVQSSDKNFMVPVSGAIIVGPKKSPSSLLTLINKSYPGRASSSSHLDLLITLLHLGKEGWLKVLKDREDMFEYLKESMNSVASSLKESVMMHSRNPVSLAFTLDNLESEKITFLGSKLFIRNVSGTRVISKGKIQNISGVEFSNYGAHINEYPHQYLTVAGALGIQKQDIDLFLQKLKSTYTETLKKETKS